MEEDFEVSMELCLSKLKVFSNRTSAIPPREESLKTCCEKMDKAVHDSEELAGKHSGLIRKPYRRIDLKIILRLGRRSILASGPGMGRFESLVTIFVEEPEERRHLSFHDRKGWVMNDLDS